MRTQTTLRPRFGRAMIGIVAAAAMALLGPVETAQAQVQTVDPDTAIDGDLQSGTAAPYGELPAAPDSYPAPQSAGNGMPVETAPADPAGASVSDWNSQDFGTTPPSAAPDDATTYHEDDLIGAAEGVFGKGAKGLADLIKDLIGKQGEPNGYIVGREAGGAIAVGLRYGSGTLYHKVEGQRPVYWTGPSIGFDAGANAASAFVLVYNLYDTEDLYKRFGAGEGQAYLIGGFNVSYLRRGDVVLIPVRSGAGLRLGANIGYMKFSHKQNWLPF